MTKNTLIIIGFRMKERYIAYNTFYLYLFLMFYEIQGA